MARTAVTGHGRPIRGGLVHKTDRHRLFMWVIQKHYALWPSPNSHAGYLGSEGTRPVQQGFGRHVPSLLLFLQASCGMTGQHRHANVLQANHAPFYLRLRPYHQGQGSSQTRGCSRHHDRSAKKSSLHAPVSAPKMGDFLLLQRPATTKQVYEPG